MSEKILENTSSKIEKLLSGKLISINAHPNFGFNIELESVDKSAVGLLDDMEFFDYCHIETIWENDIAYYKEAVLQTVPVESGNSGIIIEGIYQRELPDDKPNATFEGRIAFPSATEWGSVLEDFYQSHAERTFEEHINNMRYLRDGLKTATTRLKNPISSDKMNEAMEIISEINRMLIDTGKTDAARPH